MSKIRLLILLFWQLIINKHKTLFFKRNNIAGYIYLFIISFNSLGLGYFVSYVLKNIDESQQYVLLCNYFFYIMIFLILIKVFSNIKILQNNYIKKFINYPVNLRTILFVNFLITFVDIPNLFLLFFLIGLIIGISNLSISIFTFIFLLLLALTIIVIIHLYAEIVHTIQQLIITFSKNIFLSILLLILFLISMFLLYGSTSEIVMNNHIGMALNLILMSIGGKTDLSMLVNIFNIYIQIIFGALLLIQLKIFIINHHLKHPGIKKNYNLTPTAKSNLNIAKIFPNNLHVYLKKDFAYLLKSDRFLMALVGQFLILGFIYLNYFLNSPIFNNIYFAILLSCLFPLILWDFYISNIWGFEKGGFANYLFMPVDFKKLIIPKNLTFFVVIIPLVILVSVSLGFIFGIKYIPFLISLQFLSLFPLVSVSNINSIKNPFPVDLKESVFSSNGQFKLSILSAVCLTIIYTVITFVIISLIKHDLTETLSITTSVLSIVAFVAYLSNLNYVAKLFYNEKEKILKELIND